MIPIDMTLSTIKQFLSPRSSLMIFAIRSLSSQKYQYKRPKRRIWEQVKMEKTSSMETPEQRAVRRYGPVALAWAAAGRPEYVEQMIESHKPHAQPPAALLAVLATSWGAKGYTSKAKAVAMDMEKAGDPQPTPTSAMRAWLSCKDVHRAQKTIDGSPSLVAELLLAYSLTTPMDQLIRVANACTNNQKKVRVDLALVQACALRNLDGLAQRIMQEHSLNVKWRSGMMGWWMCATSSPTLARQVAEGYWSMPGVVDALVHLHAEQGQGKEAEEAMEWCIAHGSPPLSPRGWISLCRAWAKQGDLDRAERVLHRMKPLYPVSVDAVNAMLEGLVTRGKMPRAERFLKRWLHMSEPFPSSKQYGKKRRRYHLARTYPEEIEGCDPGSIDHAIAYTEQREQLPPFPNHRTFELLALGYVGIGKPSGAEGVLHRCEWVDLHPSARMFELVFEAYANSGNSKTIWMLMRRAERLDIDAASQGYASVVRAHCVVGEPGAGHHWMERAEAIGHLLPSDLWLDLLRGYAARGQVNMVNQIMFEGDLFENALAQQLLIATYCEQNMPEHAQDALEGALYDGVSLPPSTWLEVAKIWASMGDVEQVEKLRRKAMRFGVDVGVGMFTLVLKSQRAQK